MYFTEQGCGQRVRRIDAVTKVISTIAGSSSSGFAGDGGPASSAQFNGVNGLLAIGSSLFIADTNNNRVRRIDLTSMTITTVAGSGQFGVQGDGGAATSAQLGSPVHLAAVGDKALLISSQNRIRSVDLPSGIITLFAGTGAGGSTGDGGSPIIATFDSVAGLAGNSSTVFVSENNGIRAIKPVAGTSDYQIVRVAGVLSSNANVLSNPSSVLVDEALVVANPSRGEIRLFNRDGSTRAVLGRGSNCSYRASDNGVPASSATCFSSPRGIGVEQPGLNAVYVADSGNHRIRRIDRRTLIITDVAGNGTSSGALGDGGSAFAATVNQPDSVVADVLGNLYVSEPLTHRIRRIDKATGIISTFGGNGACSGTVDGVSASATSICGPRGLAIDARNNLLLVTESATNRVRAINLSTGVLSTVAGTCGFGSLGDGGSATAAQLASPYSVAIDPAGNLFVSESGGHRIRRIAASTGTITTLAGTGSPGFSGDGGSATSAQLDSPQGLFIDRTGNVLVADTTNNRIREIHCVASPEAGRTSDCESALPSNEIYQGQRVRVRWSVLGVTSCVATGAWSGTKLSTGDEWVTLSATGSQSFGLQCSSVTGELTTISLGSVVVKENPLKLTLTAASISVRFDGSVVITWQATNATSCRAIGNWTSSSATSGSQTVSGIRAPTTFEMACAGSTGEVWKSVSLEVVDEAPLLEMTVDRPVIRTGESSTIRWNASKASSCLASGAWSGSQPAQGTFNTGPLSSPSSSYRLTCVGPGGSVSDQV
ncbi:MAG: hypothetical protein ACKOEC_21060, partial [Acidimicrobiia bacterium]